jgi:hypothetical protein
MTKKRLVIIIVIALVVGFMTPILIQAYHYTVSINEHKLNITKIQEHLNNGGSLDDPMAPDYYEKNGVK